VAFFAILCESSKHLAMLREIYMWLNGYFMSATVDIHCPPPLSTAVIIVRSHPPRCLPPSESSATIIVCRSRRRPSCAAAVVICHVCILSSNICLGPVTRHSSFLTPSVGTQFQGYPFSSDQSHANVLVGSTP